MSNYEMQAAAPMAMPHPGAPEQAANCCWLWLDAVEDRLLRMLEGIFRFVMLTFPEWFMRMFRAVMLVARKLARVSALVLLWAGVSFVPGLFLYRGPRLLALLGLTWIGFAIAGSAWGLMHVRRRSRQEGSNGRPPAGA